MTGKQFAIIVTITFIVGMLWLVFDIIFNTKPSIPVSPQLETLIKPINPNFNPRVLEIIDKEVSSPNLPQPSSETSSVPPANATQSENATKEGQIR